MNDAAQARLVKNFEALLRHELSRVDLNKMTPDEIEALTARVRKQVTDEVKLELVAEAVGDNG